MYHQSYLDSLDSNDYEQFLFWSGQISRKPLDNGPPMKYNTGMDEEYGYEYDEGSDIDNWENEEVFQDHEGRDEEFDLDYDYDRDEAPEQEPAEDFGYFGEMGLWD